jgi:glycosyltransferase involved in cell wall biosynthesis
MPAAYAIADFVLIPAVEPTTFDLMAAEAQAMARPVIAYDSGGVPEAFIPGKTGWLVKNGDVLALAERLTQLEEDPEARLRMGRSGRDFVLEHFTLRSLVERHEALYRRLLADRRRPG